MQTITRGIVVNPPLTKNLTNIISTQNKFFVKTNCCRLFSKNLINISILYSNRYLNICANEFKKGGTHGEKEI